MFRACRFRACLAAVVAVAILIVAAPQSLYAQANFDRPGGDYQHSPVPSGDPEDCALQCERDRHCRAWSFNYPTYAAAEAVCWLKSSVPQRVENNCCVSGVRGAGVVEQRTGAIEMSTDRFGGDYRSFELKASDKDEVCKEACDADNKCRAWTYARPGYLGKDARCFLKSQIKPPHRKPGFTSGVVR
jgi:PAN domain-containing protein